MSFVLLVDPASDEQLLIRNDHVSAVEVKKGDEAVTVHLAGGQTLRLTHEQAKQFVHHVKTDMRLTAADGGSPGRNEDRKTPGTGSPRRPRARTRT
jgi:hypothetical protein